MNKVDIYKKYDISDSTKVEDVIVLLKKKKNMIHPDKTGGDFNTQKDESKYHDFIIELDFLESLLEGKNLVLTAETLPTLFEEMSMNLARINQEERVYSLIKEDAADSLVKYKHMANLPKFSSVTVSGIISMIFFFPQSIKDHPVLSKYIVVDSIFFLILWIYSIFITIMLWFLTFKAEARREAHLKYLSSSSGIESIFSDFKSGLESEEFSLEELIQFIFQRHNPRDSLFFFIQPNLDVSYVQNLSKLIIMKALDRKIISNKENQLGFSDVYVLT